jgi:hypothetical protein
MSISVKVRTGVEWVNKFHSEAVARRTWTIATTRRKGFYNEMGDHGHPKVFNWGDDNAWETDLSSFKLRRWRRFIQLE